MFFFSPRPGSLGGPDVWSATRRTGFELWSTPKNLGPVVNSALAEVQPYIASDRRTLYFQSHRPGGPGSRIFG